MHSSLNLKLPRTCRVIFKGEKEKIEVCEEDNENPLRDQEIQIFNNFGQLVRLTAMTDLDVDIAPAESEDLKLSDSVNGHQKGQLILWLNRGGMLLKKWRHANVHRRNRHWQREHFVMGTLSQVFTLLHVVPTPVNLSRPHKKRNRPEEAWSGKQTWPCPLLSVKKCAGYCFSAMRQLQDKRAVQWTMSLCPLVCVST